jgi:hypothetical protein
MGLKPPTVIGERKCRVYSSDARSCRAVPVDQKSIRCSLAPYSPELAREKFPACLSELEGALSDTSFDGPFAKQYTLSCPRASSMSNP